MRATATDPAAAWAPFSTTAATPWTLRHVGHLHRRAGLGATWKELQEGLRRGPAGAVETLVQPTGDPAAFDRGLDAEEGRLGPNQRTEYKAWWLRRLLTTPHPLQERMTLFWHDHFALDAGPVEDVTLVADYVRGVRARALGSLRDLLLFVVDHPAVLLAYDAAKSRRAMPAVELPRALLERFTLGPGVAGTADVQETARALTGRFVLRGAVRRFARQHDDGVKEILGRRGQYGPKDVVDILVANPATARWIVRRLYRWLVAEDTEPSARLLEPLAAAFATDLHVGRLVTRMVRSRHFFSTAAWRHRVKSPLELLLGLVRAGETLVGTKRLARDLDALGMDLLHPPRGRGWAGGRHWINGGTWTGRCNRLRALVRGAKAYGRTPDPAALAATHGRRADGDAFLLDLLLQGDLEATVRAGLPRGAGKGDTLRTALYRLATLPEYHLA